jgi:hypothetical protein
VTPVDGRRETKGIGLDGNAGHRLDRHGATGGRARRRSHRWHRGRSHRALVGAGIPEERAREYETGLKEGGIVMGVTPRSAEDAAYFDQEWRRYRGELIHGPEYWRSKDAAA